MGLSFEFEFEFEFESESEQVGACVSRDLVAMVTADKTRVVIHDPLTHTLEKDALFYALVLSCIGIAFY